MHESQALDLARHGVFTALELCLPILLISLIVGVIVSLFQAVTSIQEQTLTFVPKLLTISLALVVLGPWMLHTLVTFTSGLFSNLPNVIH